MNLDKYIEEKTKRIEKNNNSNWYQQPNVTTKELDTHLLKLAEIIFEEINKPVETTNEQPKKDLEILYKDQKNIQYPILYKREYGLEVQLTGMSISLQNDGTFFINDTTGG